MKLIATFFLLFMSICVTLPAQAQKKKSRIQPGTMYQPGDTLYAPRLGFTATVPQGWEGTLPRESEVFLLSSTTSTYGEIFVFGDAQGDLNSIKERWQKGVALTEMIRLKGINPTIKDNMLTTEAIAEGEYVNKGYKAFAAARCNPNGPCVIALMVAPPQYFETIKITVSDFIRKSSFEAPSNQSPYADFDWKEFLSNKVVITYQSMQGGEKENMIHLCANGTFQSNVKHTGIFKNQNPSYTGKKSGSWKVSGNGPITTLTLTFDSKKNLAPLEAVIAIEDEKILSNGDRYYVGYSDKCK